MSRVWAMQSGEALTLDIRYLLDLLVSTTAHLEVLEGGVRAKELVETLQMDTKGLVEELRETLTLNAGLLDEIVLVDTDAPLPLFGDVPEAERLPESDG